MRKSARQILRHARTIKRGWTQPDKKMRKRLSRAILKKIIEKAPALGRVNDHSKNAKTVSDWANALKGFLWHTGEKQSAQVAHHMNRISTKYALDAVGITDEALRAKVHSKTREVMDFALHSTFHGGEIVLHGRLKTIFNEIRQMLGKKKAFLFTRRFVRVLNLMRKEIPF